MENQKPDYYVNAKRKMFDLILGFMVALLLWLGTAYLAAAIDAQNYGQMGIFALIGAPIIIAIAAAIWLKRRPQRRLILAGALIAIAVPVLWTGSCLIGAAPSLFR